MGVDPILIERWLAARDHVSIRSAWEALPSVKHQLHGVHGAAQLAGAMLGERADWLLERGAGTPAFHINRICDGSFLDHVWDISGENEETLTIHERREGLRGIQRISISSGTVTGRPEGGGVNVVRVIDRDRAAVIAIDHWGPAEVATIGEIDLAPLDLFSCSWSFELASAAREVATVRALIAQLASEIDAHFDTSTLWGPGEVSRAQLFDWYLADITSTEAYVDGPRAVVIGHDRHRRLWAEAFGLAWGQRLFVTFEGQRGYLVSRFASADLDRLEIRLGAIARIL